MSAPDRGVSRAHVRPFGASRKAANPTSPKSALTRRACSLKAASRCRCWPAQRPSRTTNTFARVQGHDHRPTSSASFRSLTDTYATQARSSRAGQPDIRFKKFFVAVLGKQAAGIAAQSALPLHAQACELAHHRRHRDRHPQPQMSASRAPGTTDAPPSGPRLAERPQRSAQTIQWKFTRPYADRELGRHYASKLSCWCLVTRPQVRQR